MLVLVFYKSQFRSLVETVAMEIISSDYSNAHLIVFYKWRDIAISSGTCRQCWWQSVVSILNCWLHLYRGIGTTGENLYIRDVDETDREIRIFDVHLDLFCLSHLCK